MLTRKQHELLLLIHQRLSQQGVPPSYDEMKDALDLKSKSGIHRLITGLEERGFIRRLPHRARAVEILRLPDDMTRDGARPQGIAPQGIAPQGVAPQGFAPKVIKGDFKASLPGAAASPEADAVQLPLYGRIAAGTPIEALRDYSSYVDVPVGLLGKGEHYALEVEGDSMMDAGILDGDTVVIERGNTAETGTIIVALVDNEEVTLKRFRRHGQSIALEPANTAYETRIFPPERVQVQGRLVGLIRDYTKGA